MPKHEHATIGEIMDTVGHHGHFTFVFIPALLVTTPLSGVPGFSTLMGFLIAIASGQILVRRSSIWLPDWLRQRKIRQVRLHRALTYLDRATVLISRVTKQRLEALVGRLARRVIAALCLVCGAAMPLLEFIPFTSSIIGAFISLLSAGVIMRDGLAVIVAALPVVAAAYLIVA